jgi:hypothetical protein
MRRPQFSNETWWLVGFATFLWLIVAVAGVAMALGDPTAINAAIGCSIPGAFVTAWAIDFARQDKRLRR